MAYLANCVGHVHGVSSVGFLDESILCTGSFDGTVRVYPAVGDDTRNIEPTNSFEAHNTEIYSIAWAGGPSHLIATGSSYGSVKLWGFSDGSTARCVTDAKHSVNIPVRSVALAVRKPLIGLTFLASGKLVYGDGTALADGIILVSGSDDGTAKLWQADTGCCLLTFRHGGQAHSVAISPDTLQLAVGFENGAAVIWDLNTEAVVRLLQHTGAGVRAVEFSPDGSTIAAACGRTLFLWNAQSGTLVQRYDIHTQQINCVKFLPRRDSYFVTGSDDCTAKLFQVGHPEELVSFESHTKRVLSVAFSPSGLRLATGSGDPSAAIWDLSALGLTQSDEAIETSAFFKMLEEANSDAQELTVGIIQDLAGQVSNPHELKLFYSLVNTALKMNDITKSQRDRFLVVVLDHVAENFRFDQESRVIALLRLALDKAESDGIISKFKRNQLEETYTKSNVFADYRFQSLVQIVQQQHKQLLSLEQYAKQMDQRLRSVVKRKLAVNMVGLFLPIIGCAIGEMVCAVFDSCLETIVDFSDEEHIKEAIGKGIKMVSGGGKSALTYWSQKSLMDLLNDEYFRENPELVPLAAVVQVSHAINVEWDIPLTTLPSESQEETLESVLTKLRLSHHKQSFSHHGVETVQDMKLLSPDDLKEIGVTKIGERNRVLAWIRSP